MGQKYVKQFHQQIKKELFTRDSRYCYSTS